MSVFSLKVLELFHIFLIPLHEIVPLLLSFFAKSFSLLLNVPADSELIVDTIRLTLGDGLLKHSVDVVVSLFEALDSGNVVGADDVSDSHAVDLDAVSHSVEQVLSAGLVGLLSVSRELVQSLLVLGDDPTESFSNAAEELPTLSVNRLLSFIDLFGSNEVDGD